MRTSSTSLRRWSLAALTANVLIVVTGGAVRVTGSGLGCSDWPRCDGESFVPTAATDVGWHQYVEFGNRLLSFLVLAAVVGAFLAARRATERGATERRLAGALVGGVLAQAVLGGVSVLLDLHWATVMAHFLLSMVLIALATVLHDRAQWRARATATPTDTTDAADGTDAAGATDGARLRLLARAVPLLAAAVVVLGTVVTATGPHAGDPGTPRLPLSIVTMARAHSTTVWLTVGLTLGVVLLARRAGADRLATAAGVLLAVEVVQGAVGYWQYLTGVPPALVLLHMLLAALFWIAAVRVGLATLPVRPPVGQDVRLPAAEARA